MASTGSNVIPLTKCACSFWCLHPLHITWGLHPSSVDALVDVHSRSHNFPLIHPREVLVAGHWVTALPPLSCGIIIYSLLWKWAAWDGAGTPYPCMMDAFTQGNANLWCDEKKLVSVEDAWPSVLVRHFIRGDVCCDLMHHLPCTLHLSLSFLLPFKASAFTKTITPDFRFTAPISWS